MLQNAYFLAKIGADTAENEQHFAEILVPPRRQAPEDEGAPHDEEEVRSARLNIEAIQIRRNVFSKIRS